METNQNTFKRWLTLILPLCIPLLILFLWLARETNQSKYPPLQNQAPDFAVDLLQGGSLQLSSLRGKWVYLEFFSTTCGPCLQMLPILESLYQQNLNSLSIIAIETQADAKRAIELQKELHLSFLIAMDRTGIANDYGVENVPIAFIINPQGKIVNIIRGVHTLKELTSIFEK